MRTSESHPLRIDCVELDNGARIGLTFCPGKTQQNALTGAWRRDLEADIEAIQQAGAAALVTLIEPHEFEFLKVERLPAVVRNAGIEWLHLPITDQCAPDAEFERIWEDGASQKLHTLLDAGELVVVHCMGGLGRAGTVAVHLLIERGEGPAVAIERVRSARPGAIETTVQEQWLLSGRRRLE